MTSKWGSKKRKPCRTNGKPRTKLMRLLNRSRRIVLSRSGKGWMRRDGWRTQRLPERISWKSGSLILRLLRGFLIWLWILQTRHSMSLRPIKITRSLTRSGVSWLASSLTVRRLLWDISSKLSLYRTRSRSWKASRLKSTRKLTRLNPNYGRSRHCSTFTSTSVVQGFSIYHSSNSNSGPIYRISLGQLAIKSCQTKHLSKWSKVCTAIPWSNKRYNNL